MKAQRPRFRQEASACLMACRRRSRNRRTGSHRRGLSLIELLVVLGVIGLLVALIIPAVQRARESSRMAQCKNHLRQISLGIHNFQSQYHDFPVGNFRKQIRPFIEVSESAATVPLFACPSDSENATGHVSHGQVSYAINAGLGTGKPEHAGFVSTRRPAISPRDIADGLSNTAMIGERLAFPWYAPSIVAWDNHQADWRRTFLMFEASPSTLEAFDDACRYQVKRPLGTWYFVDEYHHLLPPNSNSCVQVVDSMLAAGSPFSTAASAASIHSSGTHIGMADGSVNFTSDHVDLNVWRALGTRAGND